MFLLSQDCVNNNQVKVLFVRNLSLKIDEDGLREFFNKLSSDRVERVKKFDDFAFINFISHEAAEVAFRLRWTSFTV